MLSWTGARIAQEADTWLTLYHAAENPTTLESLLTQYFGWSTFRPLQREVIEHVLAGGSALTVLPTGGGKSLCYQLPALLLPGVTLVISPLISLMKDQVDSLVSLGISAVAVNSQDTHAEMRGKLADVEAGRVKILYVAPERLTNGFFAELCQRIEISLMAVDEAHCVSHWGHDFRPDYRFIKDFRELVGSPPLLALTATATCRVQEDVMVHLGIADARRFLAGVDRPNLWFGVEHCQSLAEKRGKILALTERVQGSVIVYVSSRRDAEDLAATLTEGLAEPVAAYHAGMAPDERTSVQNRFMANRLRVVTATNAFGMGIDKPDIRAVIHAGVPDSVEAYFQEVGRAGRDGEPAECSLVVVPGRDVKMRQYLLEKDEPQRQQVSNFLRGVASLAGASDALVPLVEADASMGTLILSYLQTAGQLELVGRVSAGMRVKAVQPLTPRVTAQVWAEVQAQSAAKQQRFREMRRFVYLESCRRSFLLQYFGEEPSTFREGCCSACEPRPVAFRRLPKASARQRSTKAVIGDTRNVNPELWQRLQTWRRTEAQARHLPAYMIFSDRDLQGIAAAAPRDLDDLAACRGVGPVKLAAYGEEILSIVATAIATPRETSAAELFAAGCTLSAVAEKLECGEAAVWESFLAWVISTTNEIWKKQVRRVLSPEVYVAIRAALRSRLHEPLSTVLQDLQEEYGYREVTLTHAVMERVDKFGSRK